MSSQGRNEGFRTFDDFVCDAHHGPEVPRVDEQRDGRNQGTETGIAAGLPDTFGPSAAAKLSSELQLIDLLWQRERRRYTLLSAVDIMLVPSRMLSFAVAILFVLGSIYLLAMGEWMGGATWVWLGPASAALAFFFFVLIYTKARGFDRAEKGWLSTRAEAEDSWLGDRADALAKLGISPPDGKDLRTKRPRWHERLFKTSLLALLAFVIDLFIQAQGVFWLGDRDLEIAFLVTDAETNVPIAGAEIAIPKSGHSYCSECEGAFKLVTDGQGIARRMCKQCMCFGYSGGKPFFRRVNTFHPHTPHWVVEVSAAGYRRGEPMLVEDPIFRQTIRRGDEFATMEVAIKLRRLPD